MKEGKYNFQKLWHLLIDNNIITKAAFMNKSAFNTDDLTCICGLPLDYFGGEAMRKKPILRVVSKM